MSSGNYGEQTRVFRLMFREHERVANDDLEAKLINLTVTEGAQTSKRDRDSQT